MFGFDRLVYQYAVSLHGIRTTWTETINDLKYGLYLHLNRFFPTEFFFLVERSAVLHLFYPNFPLRIFDCIMVVN